MLLWSLLQSTQQRRLPTAWTTTSCFIACLNVSVCVCVSSFICVFEVVELIFTIGVMEKYVERQICSKKWGHNDGVSWSWIGNHPWAIDWHWWPLTLDDLEPSLKCPCSRSLKFHRILASDISNTVRDPMLNTKEVRQETTYGLAIGTVNVDLEWPWRVLVQGH